MNGLRVKRVMEEEKLIALHAKLKGSAPKGRKGGLGFAVKRMGKEKEVDGAHGGVPASYLARQTASQATNHTSTDGTCRVVPSWNVCICQHTQTPNTTHH